MGGFIFIFSIRESRTNLNSLNMTLAFTPLQFILLLVLFSFSMDGISSGLLFLKIGNRSIGNLLVLAGLLALTGFSVLLCYTFGKPLLFGVVLLGVEAVIVAFFLARYFAKIASAKKRFMEEDVEYTDNNNDNDTDETRLSSMEESAETPIQESDMRLIRVDWDDDGAMMPKEICIPNSILDDDVADYLSNTYGFCVNSWHEI